MAKIKCTNCGCTELKMVSIYVTVLATECDPPRDPVNNYACMKCGHVETYLREFDPIAREKREEAEKERQRVLAEAFNQAEESIADYKMLTGVIIDENATQKQAREAQADLDKVQSRFKRAYDTINKSDWQLAGKLYKEMEEARIGFEQRMQRDRSRYN